MEKIGVRTTDRGSIYVSCRIMSFAKGGRRMKNTDFECDAKETCTVTEFDCKECLYGLIYQTIVRYEQKQEAKKGLSRD